VFIVLSGSHAGAWEPDKKELKEYMVQFQRSLPKWDVVIEPQNALSLKRMSLQMNENLPET
jgi:hypothetical protein